MAHLIGQQLGNYRLISLLGHGGFGEVYLGQHVRLSKQVAIKVQRLHLSEEDIETFNAEAQTIASLDHPHIVQVLDFDVKDGLAFLVMDYAPNGSLRKRHPRGVPLALGQVVSYVKQVADALQYAHDQRLMHRDVKPDNMLLGRRNEVLLTDFGLATIAHHTSSQSTQVMAGTVPYMAPEQVQGKPRLASDQYALGIVVYEWLSGYRPFEGTATEIAMQHVLTPPAALREKVPSISLEVEQVVLTALAKDPHQRFRTVQAFATALEQACQTAPPRPMVVPSQQILPREPWRSSDEKRMASEPSQASHPTPVVTPPSQSAMPTGLTTSSSQPLRPIVAAIPSAPPIPSSANSSLKPPQKTKTQWVDEGDKCYSTRRYEEALAAYKQALQLDPSDSILRAKHDRLYKYIQRPAAKAIYISNETKAQSFWRNLGLFSVCAIITISSFLISNSLLGANNNGFVSFIITMLVAIGCIIFLMLATDTNPPTKG